MTKEAEVLADWIIGYLGNECGLIVGEVAKSDRANVIIAIENSMADPGAVRAAIELLKKPAIHKIKIDGKGDLLSRAQIAVKLDPNAEYVRQFRNQPDNGVIVPPEAL